MLRFCGSTQCLAIVLALLILAPSPGFGQVSWVKDFDDALNRAAKEKKFLVLDMSASW